MIFRGLFFERNADIGQKDHLWMGTNYLALAFQYGQNPGPVALGKHIKGPIATEKAISDYGMKMRVEPGVIKTIWQLTLGAQKTIWHNELLAYDISSEWTIVAPIYWNVVLTVKLMGRFLGRICSPKN